MKRNNFNLSYTKLSSLNMGALVPVGLTEVLPGDTFRHTATALIRTQPLLAPVMHPVHVRIHHWFVPSRLCWDNWEDFITGGPDNDFSGVYPTIDMTFTAGTPDTGNNQIGFLPDHLGVPPEVTGRAVSAIPFRAYGLIYNNFYRDQDLDTELVVSLADGDDNTTNVALVNIAWEKDYFTTARPFPQKGDAISIPLTGDAPVRGLSFQATEAASNSGATGFGVTAAQNVAAGTPVWDSTADRLQVTAQLAAVAGVSNRPQVFADLDAVSAVTINSLRLASALQRFGENRARYGSRYVEYLRGMGVKSSDARLQLPEYLGGGKQTIQFSEVLGTSNNDDTTLGELGGHGIALTKSNAYTKFFEEHGYVMTLMSVRPKTIYAQGLQRHWNRRLNMDYWQPELEHIGQQEVLNKEVYLPHATPDATFGWQDRYDEYRRSESLIAGDFRDILDFWHMARIFDADPSLNSSFVTANPTDRVFPVGSQNADQLMVQIKHNIIAKRKLAPEGTSFLK